VADAKITEIVIHSTAGRHKGATSMLAMPSSYVNSGIGLGHYKMNNHFGH